LAKFSAGDNLGSPNFDFQNKFKVEQAGPGQRLVIGPSKDHIDVMLELARSFEDKYFVLYILLVPRLEKHESGRYQSPMLSFEEAERFCRHFKAFLEGDGRHHLWLGTVDNKGTLVYDQHNIIYAYGDLAGFSHVLTDLGFEAGDVEIPFPHSHHCHREFDTSEDEMIEGREWTYFPLQPIDGQ
jgi:hypothetical protein